MKNLEDQKCFGVSCQVFMGKKHVNRIRNIHGMLAEGQASVKNSGKEDTW